MGKSLIRVAVTGGAGQIAYSLLFRIANGEMFGPDQPVALHILDIPAAEEVLKGVVMELNDCAFPLLQEIQIGTDPMKVFEGIHWALLVGAKPRGPGMERNDLLTDNGKIFVGQGRALNEVADRNVRALVVGNPCNTNSLILMHNAPSLPRTNFFAMMRLDENRAVSQLAQKSGVRVTDVRRMTIWGNHSATQVPDYYNAVINGKSVTDVISDHEWLQGPFIETVQKRGAAIIAARGKSSAASAASAVVDSVRSLVNPTPEGEWFSLAVCSDGNQYGVEEDLIFSFPCKSTGDGSYEVVNGVPLNEDLRGKIKTTQKELIGEREVVADLMQTATS